MGNYTKQELLDAFEQAIEEDDDFREQAEEALESKNKSWLSQLIEDVAERIWGWVKDSFIGWCLSKLIGF